MYFRYERTAIEDHVGFSGPFQKWRGRIAEPTRDSYGQPGPFQVRRELRRGRLSGTFLSDSTDEVHVHSFIEGKILTDVRFTVFHVD
jgi:hypothetical protein